MTTHSRGCYALLLALSLGASCAPEANQPKREAEPLVRLWELGSSQLKSPGDSSAPSESLLDEDFSAGLQAWHRVFDPDAPLVDNASALLSRVRGQGSEAELELQGTRGGLYRIVSVEPNTCYEFSGRVRTEALLLKPELPFHGGSFSLGELSRSGAPEQVFESGPANAILSFKNLPKSEGDTDWSERKLSLYTGPETRALLLACILALPGEVRSGKAIFDDIQLTKVSLARHLSSLALVEAAKRMPTAKSAWRGTRLVRENMGGETRPSLVALPGESMAFQLLLPSGKPRLGFALGSWRATEGIRFDAHPTYVVRVAGKELLRRRLQWPQLAVDARWDECDLDLAPWAGELVLIEFSVENAPGVFASPIVRELERERDGPNLILILIDTLRADYVGAYGAPGNHTPALDALAESATLVRNVSAQAPFTLPSHVSLFSGQIPSVHGVVRKERSVSEQRTPMLAEILARGGLVTRAFTAGGFVNPIFGFDRGFDGYSNLDPFRHQDSRHISGIIKRKPESFSRQMYKENSTERIKGWIDEHAKERFFLFLHTYTIHDFDPPPSYIDESDRVDPIPYTHHEYVLEHGLGPKVLGDIEAYYNAALRYVDDELGLLFEHLETTGLADKTLVVVTSDHGKEFGERGFVVHGTTLYEELTQVPLIMRLPGRAPRVLEQPAMLIDVAPTLLVAMGFEPDPRMQGLDLLASDEPRDRLIWSEVELLALKYAIWDSRGLKLIHGPQVDGLAFPNEKAWELYSLRDDPDERLDLSEAQSKERERMSALLKSYHETMLEVGRQLGELDGAGVDDETQQMLEQLGYL